MLGEMATHVGIGILIGLVVGFLLGAYTAIYYREKDTVTIMQKAAAVIVGSVWLTLHAYLIITGVGTINVFFDAIGSAAVGELLGINLVEILKSARGKKK